MLFANSYWSPDYRTCIERLTEQLRLSLNQLHELRRLVFNHMKYHYANGEYLSEFAARSYPIDSSFRAPTGPRDSRGVLTVSGTSSSDVTMKYVFHQFVDRFAAELSAEQRLAAEIDSAVLDKITGLIKHHEPQINATIVQFEELFLEYESAYEKIEKIKLEYDSLLRFVEFKGDQADSDVSQGDTSLHVSESSEVLGSPEVPESNVPQADDSLETVKPEQIEKPVGFKLPLVLGPLQFDNLEDLADFLTTITTSILVTKRKIVIPGHTNELFSSDQICEYFTKNRPRGFNPTRSNLEKLGQSLMNARIIISTGFFAKTFTSEGMWFEWSNEVMHLIHGNQESLTTSTLPQVQLSKMKLDDTQKFMTDVAASTSKTFNGMLKSMRTSLIRPKYTEEAIKQLESDYNSAYEELQKHKHLLDMEIYNKSQYLERFEKLKIEVVYQSLTKLLEITYYHSLELTNSMHSFTARFIDEFNKPDNYRRDFANTMARFSTGVYFPSFIAPDYLTRKHNNINQLNTNFQNIKLGFNLYKDVPLQLKVSGMVPAASSVSLNIRSVPVLLYEVINTLDDKTNDSWFEPIKHKDYWQVQNEIVNLVQDFVPENFNVHDHNAVESEIMGKIVSLLKEKEMGQLVNFLKNWLLEISDSVIPSTVFDSLIGTHLKKNDDSAQETVRILKTIPRSNLGSLLYIVGYISKVFDLQNADRETLEATSQKLNLMDVVGTVPFTHLLLRPSVVKNATGFKPPLDAYNAILADLLSLDVREQLSGALAENEKKFLEKQQQQVKNLGLARKPIPPIKVMNNEKPEVDITSETPTTPTRLIKVTSVAPMRVKSPNTGENFSLRPFKTGTTPRPSPTTSPVHQKEINDSDIPKSTSTNFLAPIEIKFQQ